LTDTLATRILGSVRSLGELPTLPTIANEVMALIDDPRSSPRKLTEAMKADQALTSKILRLVNSPYYSIPGGVSSVEKAITFLGYHTLFQLVIGISVIEFSRLGAGANLNVRAFWRHSLGVAVASDVIGSRIRFAGKEDLFTAGLLHDVGKIALAKLATGPFAAAVDKAAADGISLRRAEQELELPTHDRVGLVLAEHWRFPEALRVAIAHHHSTETQRRRSLARDHQVLLDITVLANDLCRRFAIGNSGDPVIPEIDEALMTRLGLRSLDVPQIKGEMTRKVDQTKTFIDLIGEDL